MSLLAGEILGLELPRTDKRLLVIAETDGCSVDGIIAATGCHVGGRTLRILDFGKIAAAFVDNHTEESLRIIPKRQARLLSHSYAPAARNHWEAMLIAYQVMPVSELFSVQRVNLNTPLSQILGRPGRKTVCTICREEIINGREIMNAGNVLCGTCAGQGYYHSSTELLLRQDDSASCVSTKTHS